MAKDEIEVGTDCKFVSLALPKKRGYTYKKDILPRIKAAFGRNPRPGDRWFRDGRTFTFVGGVWFGETAYYF